MNAMTASRASLSTRNGSPDAAIASRTRRTTSPTSTCSVPGSVGSCSVRPGTVNPNSSRSFSMRQWFSVTAPDSSNAIRNGMHDALDLHRREQQRRAEVTVAELPVEPAEGDVERVGAGLLDRRARAVAQPGHRRLVDVRAYPE